MLTREDLLNHKPLIIAGPCTVESKDRLLEIGTAVAKLGANVLRACLWKPRSHPDSFQGVGEAGLPWLKELKEKTKLPIATEIMEASQLKKTFGIADVIWVGARNMQNYELLKAMKNDPRPIMIKRGLINTVKEWLGAADYVGRNRVILIERGIRTGADAMRFTLDFNGALVAKLDHKMPVIIDPSHTAGRRDVVPSLAAAGIAVGMDGIIVEVHSCPEEAVCDAEQQILPETFGELVKDLKVIYRAVYEKSLSPSHSPKSAIKSGVSV